jgi:hypothetical protein
MSTGGVVYKDLMPIPDTNPAEHEGKATTLLDAPTESHALALNAAKDAPLEEKGAAQVAHGEEVVDLGWNEPKEMVAKPLVGGLGNEDLWLLVRRFNKVRAAHEQFGSQYTDCVQANVPCEGNTHSASRRLGYEHCR